MCCDHRCCGDDHAGNNGSGNGSGGSGNGSSGPGGSKGTPPSPPGSDAGPPPTDSEIEKAPDAPPSLKALFPPGYTVKLKGNDVYIKNADDSYTRVGTYSAEDGFKPAKNATPKSMGFSLAAQSVKDQFPYASGDIYLSENNGIWLQKADGTWVFLGRYDPATQTVTRSEAPEAHTD